MALNLSGRIIRSNAGTSGRSQGVSFDDGRAERVSADVKAQLVSLAKASASTMAGVLRMLYPSKAGGLRRGVLVIEEAAIARVQTTATHAKVYEKGSPPRRRTSGGATGRMPRANVFVPIAVRTRRSLWRDQQAVLDQPREIV